MLLQHVVQKPHVEPSVRQTRDGHLGEEITGFTQCAANASRQHPNSITEVSGGYDAQHVALPDRRTQGANNATLVRNRIDKALLRQNPERRNRHAARNTEMRHKITHRRKPIPLTVQAEPYRPAKTISQLLSKRSALGAIHHKRDSSHLTKPASSGSTEDHLDFISITSI